MNVTQLFEEVDDRLTGFINIPGLTRLLPDITNASQFDEAIDKIRLGQANFLTVPEKMQLAQAFIGLIGLDAPKKSQVMALLSGVRTIPHQGATNSTLGTVGTANKTA